MNTDSSPAADLLDPDNRSKTVSAEGLDQGIPVEGHLPCSTPVGAEHPWVFAGGDTVDHMTQAGQRQGILGVVHSLVGHNLHYHHSHPAIADYTPLKSFNLKIFFTNISSIKLKQRYTNLVVLGGQTAAAFRTWDLFAVQQAVVAQPIAVVSSML